MTTRDLSNRRVKFAIGTANSVANVLQPTLAELSALLDISPAVRWSGFDFGIQASSQEDDRSLTDDASATIRSFNQFGGALPLFFPKVTDLSSILRQAYNLVKNRNTELVVAERVGFKDNTTAFAAADEVNCYRVMTDGWTPDTAGTGGYAYLLNLTPRGDSVPYFIVPPATAASVTITGAATATLTSGNVVLREATYQGLSVTSRATWISSNPAVATVDDGIIIGVSAGTANITAAYPGATTSTAVAVTVS